MKYYEVFIIVLLIIFTSGCMTDTATDKEKKMLIELREDIAFDLKENLLPFWKENSVDHDDPNKGFYGAIENDGKGVSAANKHNVLFTRYLWTFSAASRVLDDNESLLLADRAYAYITSFFLDKGNGGIYWNLNADGTVADSTKMTYGQAFAIYSLSEYYRATHNQESLDLAIEIFELVEENVYDKEYGGYFEAFSADWQYLEGEGIAAGQSKSMNTHLHLLEAYTNLYRVWPDSYLEEKIRHLIELFQNNIVNTETFHQELYFERDWKVYGRYDSYGHDIEFSWLFDEAGKVTGDSLLIMEIQDLSLKIAEIQLSEGMNPQGAMIYEKEGEDNYRNNISWWVQAEAVVGFLNAYELSHDIKFLQAATGVWEYIKDNMIDFANGGWFPDLDESGTNIPGRMKGDSWTGPYHNVRMGLEVYERLHHLE